MFMAASECEATLLLMAAVCQRDNRRSKDALDDIYVKGSAESERILTALEVYGARKISDEIKYCVAELLKVCAAGQPSKLRDIVFEKGNTNAFPSVFAVVLIAVHELIVGEKKKIDDYGGVKRGLTNLSSRMQTGRRATGVEERRKNIDTVKGLIASCFVEDAGLSKEIYSDHTTVDIEAIIRRSEIELSNYELKQGLLVLEPNGGQDVGMIEKVVNTICAIANNGSNISGKILIGVTNKESDAQRVREIDGIDAQKVGRRFVVGVNREAKRLGVSVEQYFGIWKEGIKNSKLSINLRDDVLSSLDFNSFYGLGLIVISIPPQKEVSYVGEQLFWRNGDATELATQARQIAAIAGRF